MVEYLYFTTLSPLCVVYYLFTCALFSRLKTTKKRLVDMLNCAENLTTPIIHEHHAKDMFMGFFNGNVLSKTTLSSHKECLVKKKDIHNKLIKKW